MSSQFGTPDINDTQDLFDISNDLSDSIDNTQQQQIPMANNQQPSLYQPVQQRVNYVPQAHSQLSSANLQCITTPAIVRPTNVVSNGIQQQSIVFPPQQMMNTSRLISSRMSTPPQQQQQNMLSTLVRQPYNTPGMVSLSQNVTQVNVVKPNDSVNNNNNNNIFGANSQQQSTLIDFQPQHTMTQTVQGNRPIPTGLTSMAQPLSQYQIQTSQIPMQQSTSLQTHNIRVS